jgi:hypothetical protein
VAVAGGMWVVAGGGGGGVAAAWHATPSYPSLFRRLFYPCCPCSTAAAGGATKHLQEALRVDPDCAPAGRLLKALRKAEALKTAGNDHFKAGRYQQAWDAYR